MSDPVVLLSTGDVVGPAGGVTDNSMVLFSGTSGKIIKGNNAVVTAAGLALLDDVNAAAQRVTLGLGTAATANVTTSNADGTAGRVIKVGDFGLGALNVTISNTDLNALNKTGFYMGSVLTNSPDGTSWYYVIHQEHGAAGYSSQIAIELGSSASEKIYARRKVGGSWTGWREIALTDSPAFTGTPTAPTASAGTNTTQLANTAFVKTAIDNVNILKSIGIDQTWQDLTGSRTFGVTYTNSTGRPIVVSIGFKTVSGNENVYFRVNGVVVSYSENGGAGDSLGPLGNIVPAGATYILDRAAGSIENWAELR